MRVTVHHRCHACGTRAEAIGARPWITCPTCEAVLGFDWMALQRSDEYQRWLRSEDASGEDREAYSRALGDADLAADAGDTDACRRHLERAARLGFEVFPYLYPPRARDDAAYRDRHLEYATWSLYQQRTDPELLRLLDQMATATSELDLTDPLPSLERLADLAEAQTRRLEELDGPPDPDDMPTAERARISLGFCLGGYLPYVSPEHRVALLERIHGPERVTVEGDPAGDSFTPFTHWTCPACAMVSLQPAGTSVAMCPACAHRQPLGSDEDDAARGEPGVEVTETNRDELVVAGLARMANVFGRMISADQLADLIRRSLPDRDLGEMCERIAHASRHDGGDDTARQLVADAAAKLR